MQGPHERACICVDYVITSLLPLSSHYTQCVCVCLLSCPSRLCVNVGRADQCAEEKTGEEKKFRPSATASARIAFKTLGDWCVAVAVIEDREALGKVRKRKERKPRQTYKARL